jgi:multidrug efflux pump subunit AcrA (membrane-fusion protein)
MAKFPLKIAAGAVVVAVIVGGGLIAWHAQQANRVSYVTAPVERGTIRRTIAASGSVNPEITVQVGAFISGTIKALNCDYNTPVKKGQVCATIDPRPYQLAADQAKAALSSAQAQLAKDKASLAYATLVFNRMALLLQQDSVSRDAVDNARSLRDEAQAQVALDQATDAQRKASLESAQVNLGYTAIVSPVDGVVVSRNVTVGQTVASSFQTPTLFITYDVVIAADNPDLLLKPGMTANARIITAERNNVLRVPLQALNYAPAAPGPVAPRGRKAKASQAQQVWVLENGQAKSVPVVTGLDDDANVEITAGALKAGDLVIVSATRAGQKTGRTRPAAAAPIRFGP